MHIVSDEYTETSLTIKWESWARWPISLLQPRSSPGLLPIFWSVMFVSCGSASCHWESVTCSDCCPGQTTVCARGSKEIFALVQKSSPLFKSLGWQYYLSGRAPLPRTGGWDSGHCPSQSGTWPIHSGSVITCIRPHHRCNASWGAQVNPKLGRCDISLIPALSVSHFTVFHKEQGVGFATFTMLYQISVWDVLCLIFVSTLRRKQCS